MIEFGELIGQTISDVFVAEDFGCMQFSTTSGIQFVYQCEGDCCNDVWFAHISGIECLIGATVFGIDIKGWRDVEATRQECEEASFWTLRTTGGRFDIEVRNSSNGYYGGNIVFSGNETIQDAIQITEDF